MSSLFAPETATPEQMYEPRGALAHLPGHHIAAAVLQEAIETRTTCRGDLRTQRRRLFLEADAWIHDDTESLKFAFTFQHICSCLGFFPDQIRREIAERDAEQDEREIVLDARYWQPVFGSWGYRYLVHKDGRIWDNFIGGELVPAFDNGHLIVTLERPTEEAQQSWEVCVKDLVARVWLRIPKNALIFLKDQNPWNCSVENIEWKRRKRPYKKRPRPDKEKGEDV